MHSGRSSGPPRLPDIKTARRRKLFGCRARTPALDFDICPECLSFGLAGEAARHSSQSSRLHRLGSSTRRLCASVDLHRKHGPRNPAISGQSSISEPKARARRRHPKAGLAAAGALPRTSAIRVRRDRARLARPPRAPAATLSAARRRPPPSLRVARRQAPSSLRGARTQAPRLARGPEKHRALRAQASGA